MNLKHVNLDKFANKLRCAQVFLLVHTVKVKLKDIPRRETEISKAQSDTKEMQIDPDIHLNSSGLPNVSSGELDDSEPNPHVHDPEKNCDKGIDESSPIVVECANDSENISSGKFLEKVQAGAHWDIFHRKDVPKLMEYISMHWADLGVADYTNGDYVS